MKTELKKILTDRDVEIAYEVNKSKSKEFLIFLHGLGGNLTAWDNEVFALAEEGISSIVIDIRGHGRSSRPQNSEDYTMEKLATDVKRVVDHEKVKKFTLVGHCFGGMVAMYYTHLFPKDVASLILINSSYRPFPPSRYKLVRIFINNFLNIFSKVATTKHYSSYLNFDEFIGTADLEPKRLFKDITHTSPKSYINILKATFTYDAEKYLKSFNIPTLIIHGEDDRLFSKSIAQKLHKSIPKNKLVFLKKTNHISVINNSKGVKEEIEKFIDANSKL